MEDLLRSSVVPIDQLLRGEQVELVPFPDSSHPLFECIHTAARTSVDVSNSLLFDVRSEDVLNEVVEVVATFRQLLVILELLVGHELEVAR